MVPFLEKNVNGVRKTLITEDAFFEFFASKKLKLIIAVLAGIVGVIGNFYAVRAQILSLRFDMIGESMAGVYAFGLTGFLDLAIVLFTLMGVSPLAWFSAGVAFIISLYANITLMLHSAGGSDFSQIKILFRDPNSLLQFFVAVSIAVLPIVILKYLTMEAMKQRRSEKNA